MLPHSFVPRAPRTHHALVALVALTLLSLLSLFALRSHVDLPASGRPAITSSTVADSAAMPAAMPAAALAGSPPAIEATGLARMSRRAEESAPADAAAPAPDAALPTVSDPASDATTMIVRSGAASVEVDSLDAATARVRALAARLGGFVANASLAAGHAQVRTATLEIRLPAARFDELLGGLAPLGRVETVNVSAEDVGEEYVDVGAREANARRLEARLVALLADRTGRLTDVLAVERELARVREEIERYEGRLRYLRAHAATSTLAITVHERPPLVGDSPAASPIGDAVRQAWRNLVALVAWLVAASGIVVPLGIIALIAWRIIERRRAVHSMHSGSEPPVVEPRT